MLVLLYWNTFIGEGWLLEVSFKKTQSGKLFKSFFVIATTLSTDIEVIFSPKTFSGKDITRWHPGKAVI